MCANVRLHVCSVHIASIYNEAITLSHKVASYVLCFVLHYSLYVACK